MKTCGWIAMVVLAAWSSPLGAQTVPPRDPASARPAAGTAVLAGVVSSDDESARPLGRVTVTLSGTGVAGGAQVVTDASGRFVFADLPAGRYTLTADKPAYVTTYYGSARPGRGPGTAIALADGQRLTSLSIRLARGAVIEGTIVDENGLPIASAQVTAMEAVIVNGERKFVTSAGRLPWVTSDDRGVYRIYGLPPGDYTVRSSGGLGVPGEVRLTTAAEIDAAMGNSPTRVGSAAPLVARVGGYFPGVADASAAETLTLAAGQERLGVDIRSVLIRPSRVDGTTVGGDGRPARNAAIGVANVSTGSLWTSIGGVRPDGDGRFSMGNLPPGRYLFFGRAGEDAARDAAPQSLPLWAATEVTVNEQESIDIVLPFLPGSSITGGLVFTGSATALDPTKIRVALTAVPAIAGTMLSTSPIAPAPDGSFVIPNVAPGRYRLTVAGVAPWWVRSAIAGGRDTMDAPLEVLGGRDVSGLAVLLTDRPGEISGRVLDEQGRPASDGVVLIFPTDPALRGVPRRTSGAVRAGSDGHYTVTGLPPGEYFVASVMDGAPPQLADPIFLEQLARTAVRVTLAEAERKLLDVKR